MAAKAVTDENIIVVKTEETPVKSLKVYHKNPRVGNVPEIAKSLHLNGQFRPILVNLGTKTGRKNEILAGNHTFLGSRKEIEWVDENGVEQSKKSWPKILASFVDVTEVEAAKIVLADNKLADEGTYDEKVLAELMADLPDFTGTGFSQDEADDILAGLNSAVEDATSAMSLDDLRSSMPDPTGDEESYRPVDPRQAMMDNETEEERDNAIRRGASRPSFESDRDVEEVEQDPEGPDEEDVLAELQGMLEVKEEMLWRGDNYFQVPDLREDMLVTEFPDNIQTWAGKDVTPDDGKKWFWYNYGLGGAKGLPLDRTILGFNTHDNKFDGWWETPAYYAAKMISGGLRNAVAPDFSFYYTMPRFVHLQGVYKSQWLARFLQESGVRIIPRVQFDDEKSLEINMLGIPKNPPYLTASMQNFGREGMTKEEQEAYFTKILQQIVDKVEPTEGMIIYGGNPGKRILEGLDLHGAKPIWVENYAAVRRGLVFDKADGLKAKSGKERKEIRERARKAEAERLGIPVEELGERNRQPIDPDEEEFAEEQED